MTDYTDARALAERCLETSTNSAANTISRALLAALGELEGERQNTRAYGHEVQTGRDEQHDLLVAARDRLTRELRDVREQGVEAAHSWGFASGHADTLADLYGEVAWQVQELRDQRDRLARELEEARSLADRLKQEAQIQAQEMRTQRATVREVGSLLGGMADWQDIPGAVRDKLREPDEAKRERDAWRDLALDLRSNIQETSYRDAVEQQIAALEAKRG